MDGKSDGPTVDVLDAASIRRTSEIVNLILERLTRFSDIAPGTDEYRIVSGILWGSLEGRIK